MSKENGAENYRLPTNLKPINYDLHLQPNLVNFTFRGQSVIELDILKDTNEIVCNAKNLCIESVSVDEKKLDDSAVQLDEANERLILRLGSVLSPGKCKLDIIYTGILNDQMRGFYRSKYSINGEQRYAAVTQFASTDARQAFPCWDEPAWKATFNVTVTGPTDRIILSNMPVKEEMVNGDVKTVKFEVTPVMSTYLLAIVVGEFDYIQGKEGIAYTVCHETAHQWFGNLVTMEWWTHLWLNEGFASFLQYLATDHIYPELTVFQQFVPDTLIRALNLDCLASSHPIEVDVKNPADINQIFDAISYSKGGSILRMLYTWLGEDSVKKGLQKYLTKYQHMNAKTEDLWKELESESGKPVADMMSNWTSKLGYPAIHVQSRQEGTNRIVTLKQRKHSLIEDKTSKEQTIWKIPISIISNGGKEVAKVILEEVEMKIIIENCSVDDWFKLNPDFTGYYRVDYSKPDMDRLLTALRRGDISSPLDRLNLVDDLFSLVLAGQAETTDWLALVHNFTFSWNSSLEDDHHNSLLRCQVLSILCLAGDTDIIKEGEVRFHKHVDGTQLLQPDLREPAYECIGQSGKVIYYDQLIQLYQDTESSQEKLRILRKGLASFSNKDILKSGLEFALSDKVRAQDAIFMFVAVAQNPIGRQLAWQAFKENIGMLNARYGSGHLMSSLVKGVTEQFHHDSHVENIKQFFKGIDKILMKAAWIDRDLDKIKPYLDNFVKSL